LGLSEKCLSAATVDVVAAVLSVWKNLRQVGPLDKKSLSE
jgi:hypothetical protein